LVVMAWLIARSFRVFLVEFLVGPFRRWVGVRQPSAVTPAPMAGRA
jgi:hypothetical protein